MTKKSKGKFTKKKKKSKRKVLQTSTSKYKASVHGLFDSQHKEALLESQDYRHNNA